MRWTINLLFYLIIFETSNKSLFGNSSFSFEGEHFFSLELDSEWRPMLVVPLTASFWMNTKVDISS